jgi:hypothetical protein
MKAERFSLMSLALLMALSLCMTRCQDTVREASLPAGPGDARPLAVTDVGPDRTPVTSPSRRNHAS